MQYYKRIFAKPCKYKGIVFRSHLERDFAKYMTKNHIEWEYEKHKFELLPREEYYDNIENKKHILRSVVFIPDFYLPKYNLIVEIKGYPYDSRLFKLKLRLFKSKYSDRNIVVLKSRDEFNNLKNILENLKNNNYIIENKQKIYNPGDEFLSDDEKLEIMQAILEAEEAQEREM